MFRNRHNLNALNSVVLRGYTSLSFWQWRVVTAGYATQVDRSCTLRRGRRRVTHLLPPERVHHIHLVICLHKVVPRNHRGICSRQLDICRILCPGIILRSRYSKCLGYELPAAADKQQPAVAVVLCRIFPIRMVGPGRSRLERLAQAVIGMTFFSIYLSRTLGIFSWLCCRRHIPYVSWHPSTDLSLL